MNTENQKKVLVEFFLSPAADKRPLVENLVRGERLTVNIRRARVTSRDAWLQLDVSGASDAVDTFIRRRKDVLTVVTPLAGMVA